MPGPYHAWLFFIRHFDRRVAPERGPLGPPGNTTQTWLGTANVRQGNKTRREVLASGKHANFFKKQLTRHSLKLARYSPFRIGAWKGRDGKKIKQDSKFCLQENMPTFQEATYEEFFQNWPVARPSALAHGKASMARK